MLDDWNQLDFFIVVASIIDWCSPESDLGFIKILRLLRTFRPLRFLSHNKGMRLVVNALMDSVNAIMNVTVVVILI